MADGVRAMWHPRWDFQCKFHLMTLKVFIQRRASRPIIWEFTRGLASNIFMSLKRSWKASREPDLNTLKQSLQATHRSKTGTSDPRRATNGPNHRDDKQNVLRAAAIMLGWLTKRLGFFNWKTEDILRTQLLVLSQRTLFKKITNITYFACLQKQ